MNDLLKQLLSRATTPLIPQVGEAADSAAQTMTTPKLDESPMMAKLKGFGAGALSGAGHYISDNTSPANIAALLAGTSQLRGAKGIATGASQLGLGMPAAETLGEMSAAHTPVGGESFFNMARQAGKAIVDPAEAAYHRLLQRGGR